MKNIAIILLTFFCFKASSQVHLDTLAGYKKYVFITPVRYQPNAELSNRLYATIADGNDFNSADIIGQVGWNIGYPYNTNFEVRSRQTFSLNPSEYSAWQSNGDAFLFPWLATKMGVVMTDTLTPAPPDTSVHITYTLSFTQTASSDFVIYPIAGRLLQTMVLYTASGTQNIRIGTTSGGSDIMTTTEVGTAGLVLQAGVYNISGSSPIYVSGVTGTITIKYYEL